MKRTAIMLGLLIAICLVSGCSLKYKAVGVFDNSSEVFIGDLDHDLLSGRAQIITKSMSSNTICRGYSYVTHVPMFSLGCSGQQGKAPLQCTDGRRMDVDWTAESCSSGSGYGVDQYGNTFSLAFGFDETGAREMLATITGTSIPDGADKNAPPANKSVEQVSKSSTGTGFFITETGVLITNFHVVDGATAVHVVHDGELIEASILKSDPNNDLAILKVQGMRSRSLSLAKETTLIRGEEILTLGYPLSNLQGLEQKATTGRVNALSGAQDDIRFIQIDAPIQPGNSGGPLLDAKGNVVGVVSAGFGLELLEQTGTLAQNVGYALKVDYIWPLLRTTTLDAPLANTKNSKLKMPELIKSCEDAVIQVYVKL